MTRAGLIARAGGATRVGIRWLTVALLVAGCAVAATPSPSPSTAPSSVGPTTAATASAAPTPAGPVACLPAGLTARITRWEGTAGSWVAHIEVRNAGTAACVLASAVRPQLIDAKGTVLIEPTAGASASASIPPVGGASPAPAGPTLAVGAIASTQVRVGNYCGPAPATPLSIAFVLPAGGRLTAAPLSATDETVPSCLGTPGTPGSIEMQPWSV
jgi:hypothetical protein